MIIIEKEWSSIKYWAVYVGHAFTPCHNSDTEEGVEAGKQRKRPMDCSQTLTPS